MFSGFLHTPLVAHMLLNIQAAAPHIEVNGQLGISLLMSLSQDPFHWAAGCLTNCYNAQTQGKAPRLKIHFSEQRADKKQRKRLVTSI